MDGPTSSCCLKDLPHDVLLEVFYQLSCASVATTSSACHSLYALAQSPSLWQSLCKTTFGLTFRDKRELCNLSLSTWKEVFKDLFSKSSSMASLTRHSEFVGCPHYTRNCQIRAKCCSDFFPCRLCHDGGCKNRHTIDRFSTDTMLCMKCLCVQAVNQYCTSCHAEMAPYYCAHCKLWSALEKGPIYHCDKCGICRQGQGLGIDNWHCDDCGICLSLSMKDTHECQIKDGLKSTCPLCPSTQHLFYSREPVTVLTCGHASHVKCLQERLQQNLPPGEHPCLVCERQRQQQSDERQVERRERRREQQIISYQHSTSLFHHSPFHHDHLFPHDKLASCNRGTCPHHN